LIQCRTFYRTALTLTFNLFPATRILYVNFSFLSCVQHAQPNPAPRADSDIRKPKCQKRISAEFSNDLSRCVSVRLQAVKLSHFFIPVHRLSMEAGRNGRSGTPCLSVCLTVTQLSQLRMLQSVKEPAGCSTEHPAGHRTKC
jgi:hypothetical protein